MTAPVPFEPRRFQSAAAHYLQGRPPYAPALLRRVAALCGLDGRHRVLDLGCGPGHLALGFAAFAGEVVAIDPEPEMLRLAAGRAAGLFPTVRFRQGSSYDLGPELGTFHLAVIGRAFHWMDRPDTLRRLDALIAPGGAVALFTDLHPRVPENAWLRELRELRDRAAGDAARPFWRAPGWVRHEAVLLDSPFPCLERAGVIERRRMPCSQLADRVLSMSGTSRGRIGDAAADRLAADVTALAQRVAVDGEVTEVVESSALVARRAEA